MLKQNLSNIITLTLRYFNAVRYWDWQYSQIQSLFLALAILVFTRSYIIFDYSYVIFFSYLCTMSIYGYTLNSYIDRSQDIIVNKDQFQGFSIFIIKNTVLISAIVSLFLPVLFKNTLAFFLGIIIFILATLYSYPPVRFKESELGVIVAVITQRAPFLFFLVLYPKEMVIIFYLFIWLLLTGFIVELTHQFLDYKNDKKINITTFVTCFELSYSRTVLFVSILALFLYLIIGVIFYQGIFATSLNQSIFIVLLLFTFSHDSIRGAIHSLSIAQENFVNNN